MGLKVKNYVPAVALNRGVVGLTIYTVATAPTATTFTGGIIYVSNGAAGAPVVAFSNGTNWLRVDTLATIAAA